MSTLMTKSLIISGFAILSLAIVDNSNAQLDRSVPNSPPTLSDKASIDCTKAGSGVAKILCGSREAATADWDLNSTLWAVAGTITEAQQKAFNQDQDRWRSWLNNKCLQPMPVANDTSQEQQRCVIREFHSRAELLRSKLTGDLLAESRLSPEQHAQIQEMLIARGLLNSPADGEFGSSTRQAIRNFQDIAGAPQTGVLSREQARAALGAPINLGGTATPTIASSPGTDAHSQQASPQPSQAAPGQHIALDNPTGAYLSHLNKPALPAVTPTVVAKTPTQEDLVISVIDHELAANPLCEGGPRVCQSGRFLMIVMLNMSNRTYDKATLVCSIFRKDGGLIETKTQEVPGPIMPRRVNRARGQPRNAPALIDRAMADAVALVEFKEPFPSGTDPQCSVKPESEGVIASSTLKTPATLDEPVAIEFLRAGLTKSNYSTEIRMEFVARYFVARPTTFARVICEIFDGNDRLLGHFSRDYAAYGRGRPFMLVPGRYWRPTMRIDSNVQADSATCRFATRSDPLPTVSADEIELQLVATHYVRTVNRSPYDVESIIFTCEGQNVSTSYQNHQSLGIAPDEVMVDQYLRAYAERCVATEAKAAPSPDMSAPLSR